MLPLEFWLFFLVHLLTSEFAVEIADSFALLLAINLDLLVNVAVVFLQLGRLVLLLLLFALFDGLLTVDTLQKVAIFVHVEG